MIDLLFWCQAVQIVVQRTIVARHGVNH